jgi:hypothetical protein
MMIDKIKGFGGWPASLILTFLYFASELGSFAVGGDAGGFLWVTFHFVLMPLLSLGVLCWAVVRTLRTTGAVRKFVVLSSSVIPVAIIFVAITGEPGLARFFRLS